MGALLKSLLGFGRANMGPLLIALAVFSQMWATIAHKNNQITTLTASRDQERTNHRLTKANFRGAMAQAKADNLAAVRAEDAKRAAITQRSARNAQTAHDRLDARYAEWLRAHPAARASAGSDPGKSGMPALSGAARTALATPADARSLPFGADASGRVCIAPETALTLAQDAINHDGLIDWVVAQMAVNQTPLSPANP